MKKTHKVAVSLTLVGASLLCSEAAFAATTYYFSSLSLPANGTSWATASGGTKISSYVAGSVDITSLIPNVYVEARSYSPSTGISGTKLSNLQQGSSATLSVPVMAGTTVNLQVKLQYPSPNPAQGSGNFTIN